jgi:hypothetical protein
VKRGGSYEVSKKTSREGMRRRLEEVSRNYVE